MTEETITTATDEAKRLLDNAAEVARLKTDFIARLRSEIEERKAALAALGAVRVRKASDETGRSVGVSAGIAGPAWRRGRRGRGR